MISRMDRQKHWRKEERKMISDELLQNAKHSINSELHKSSQVVVVVVALVVPLVEDIWDALLGEHRTPLDEAHDKASFW